MLDLSGVGRRRDSGRGCGRGSPAVGRVLVLAAVDMPAVTMPAAVMTRASRVTTPVVDARTTVMGPGSYGRRGRPRSGYRGENARHD